MCVPCKIIINNGVQSLTQSIETILTNPDIYTGTKLTDDVRLELLDRLLSIDYAVYSGDQSKLTDGGLRGIMIELQNYGLIDDEVWQVYSK